MDSEKCFGFLLNNAARLLRQDLDNRTNALGLTFPQSLVLKDLASHSCCEHCQVTMAAIARRLNTRRPNIFGIIERLEKLGLVTKTVNPNNRRAHIISLTKKAQSFITQLQECSRLATDRALRGFKPDEVAVFQQYLTRISNNYNTEGDERG